MQTTRSVKASVERYDKWAAAAQAKGVTLNKWMCEALDQVAALEAAHERQKKIGDSQAVVEQQVSEVRGAAVRSHSATTFKGPDWRPTGKKR